jgi:nicotinamidase-related amidase
MASLITSSAARLVASNSIFFVCDIQEKFRPLIHRYETVIQQSALFSKVANLLDIPIIVTEQMPDKLGATVTELSSLSIKIPTAVAPAVFSKSQFSMMTEEVKAELERTQRKQVILCGIEAHVCVLQSTMELLASGYSVNILCDAVSSSRAYDRAVALRRMERCGAVLSTTESSVFELMGASTHPRFRDVSKLIKENAANKNEFASDTAV